MSERADDDHRELESFGLVDRHDLDVALGEGLVRVLVLVDAALVEEPQEAVEEMEAEVLAVVEGDDGVVVIVLEGVQELGEDGQVAGPVLVLHVAQKTAR